LEFFSIWLARLPFHLKEKFGKKKHIMANLKGKKIDDFGGKPTASDIQ
jgi:hypothetical protein